jgi:hypothetical protein
MRTFLATAVLALFLAPAAFAGGSFEDSPEQMAIPQTKVVVVQPDGGDNTAIYVGAATAILVAGITTFGVIKSRKG